PGGRRGSGAGCWCAGAGRPRLPRAWRAAWPSPGGQRGPGRGVLPSAAQQGQQGPAGAAERWRGRRGLCTALPLLRGGRPRGDQAGDFAESGGPLHWRRDDLRGPRHRQVHLCAGHGALAAGHRGGEGRPLQLPPHRRVSDERRGGEEARGWGEAGDREEA
ncbi:unnamed protein product, partial [Effrenium voratum]